MYCLKVFLLTKINPEYSGILYNPTHFLGRLVCRIRQVTLYVNSVNIHKEYKICYVHILCVKDLEN